MTRFTSSFPKQAALCENELLMMFVKKARNHHLFTTDTSGLIRDWFSSRLYDYSTEEVTGKHFSILLPESQPQNIAALDLASAAKDGEHSYTAMRKRKDGTVFNAHICIIPQHDREGQVTGFAHLTEEIEDASRHAYAAQDRTLFESNPMPMWLLHPATLRFIEVNSAAIRQYGYTREEFLAMSAMEIRPESEKERFKGYPRGERGPHHSGQWQHLRKDGTLMYVDVYSQEIAYHGIEARLVLSIDVTERVLAEQQNRNLTAELAKSEKKFRALIENSMDIFSITGPKGEAMYRSPSAERVTGFSSDERNAAGMGLTHPDDAEMLAAIGRKVFENPGVPFPVSFRTLHKNGHYIWVEGVITNMIHDDAIGGIVSNFRDVTLNRQNEEKLRQSEKIYKTIASGIPGSVICLLDKDYRFLLIEGDMLEKIGYTKEQLLGQRAIDVLPPERYRAVISNYRRAFSGETFTVEVRRGSYDLLTRFVPLKNEAGEVNAVMTVVIDITELKKAQRDISELNRNLEQKVIERTAELQEINRELDAFTYSVSHDLRAPLRAVNGYARILEEDYSGSFDTEGRRLLNVVQDNARQMGVLIDNLLGFSRLGRKEVKKTRVDMQELVAHVVTDLGKEPGHHAEISVASLPAVTGDHALLRHVVVNLLSNAIKYSSRVESPKIRVESLPMGNEIVFSVTDNGAGFDMEYADKLFGVFQRLHDSREYEGSGVGLAIVQRIITKHGGKVWAKGKPNEGAAFYFSLPDSTPQDQTKNEPANE